MSSDNFNYAFNRDFNDAFNDAFNRAFNSASSYILPIDEKEKPDLELPETHLKIKEDIDDYKRRFPLIGEPLEIGEPPEMFRITNTSYETSILENYLNNITPCIENVTYDDNICTFYNYRTFDYDKYFNFIIKFKPSINGNPSELKCIEGWISDSLLFNNNQCIKSN
jgi:hypothetical protein